MEDYTNISFDIKAKLVPTRTAPIPPIKSLMSKQSSNQSRYSILSTKLFQPNLKRQNALKKKSAPPRPPPPNFSSLTRSQTTPNFGLGRNLKSNNFHSKSKQSSIIKQNITDVCLIDLSSSPNYPYAGSGSDGVSVNSFGSENSSNNQSASEEVIGPFGLICEDPHNVGFASFYGNHESSINQPSAACDDDDPFKEIALRHCNTEQKQAKPAQFNAENNITAPQTVKSQFYAKDETAKPFRATIIRPKNQTKVISTVNISQITKPPSSQQSATDDKDVNASESQIAEALYDFVAAEMGDLSIQIGQKVEILRKVNSDWFYGKTTLGEGMFPASYVKIFPSSESSVQSHKNDCISGSKTTVKALYTFSGEVNGDLCFQEGENVCVLGKINDDWLYGEAHSMRGQFPATFVNDVPANLPNWVPSS